jgi:hypothetical protein
LTSILLSQHQRKIHKEYIRIVWNGIGISFIHVTGESKSSKLDGEFWRDHNTKLLDVKALIYAKQKLKKAWKSEILLEMTRKSVRLETVILKQLPILPPISDHFA